MANGDLTSAARQAMADKYAKPHRGAFGICSPGSVAGDQRALIGRPFATLAFILDHSCTAGPVATAAQEVFGTSAHAWLAPLWAELAAAIAHEPHRVAFYLFELAGEFHALWNKGKDSPQLRFILKEDEKLTTTRLAFLRAIRYVLANGLRILGVRPAEEM